MILVKLMTITKSKFDQLCKH